MNEFKSKSIDQWAKNDSLFCWVCPVGRYWAEYLAWIISFNFHDNLVTHYNVYTIQTREFFGFQFLLLFSVAQLCPTLCDLVDCSMLGFPVLHYLPKFAQTHVHWIGDSIQSSHPLSPSSSPALDLSQHQGLFQWASSSHQVANVLELQLQHQSFQWIFRVDFI